LSRAIVESIERNTKYFVYAIILIALFFGLLGVSPNVTDAVINLIAKLFVGSLVGAVMSLPAAVIVEAFSGDWLKTVFLVVEIHGFKFSISVFVIVTFIITRLLFG